MKKIFQICLLGILLPLLAVYSHKVFAQSYYKDVTDKTTGAEAFAYLIQQGILTADPDTPFGPNEVATRYDAIHMIVKALALPTENIEVPTFTDVKADDPRLPIIAAAVNTKLIAGNDKGELQLDKPLTRAEIAAIISKGFNLNTGQSKVFFDVPQKHWAKNQSINSYQTALQLDRLTMPFYRMRN